MLGIKQSVFGAFSREMGENVKTQSGVNPLIMDDLAFVHTHYTDKHTPGRHLHICTKHTRATNTHTHTRPTSTQTQDIHTE